MAYEIGMSGDNVVTAETGMPLFRQRDYRFCDPHVTGRITTSPAEQLPIGTGSILKLQSS